MTEPATGDGRPRPARVGRVRLRILGWLVVLLALANVASVLLLRKVLLDRLDAEVEASLVQEVRELETLVLGRDPNTGQPFGGNVAAIFDTFLRHNIPAEGEALFTVIDAKPYKASRSVPHPLDQDPALVARWWAVRNSEEGRVSTPAGPVRYLAIRLHEADQTRGVFVVANFVSQERDEVESAVRTGAVVSLSVLVGASALAWIVAGRLLAPVRLLTETAQSISETDLRRRIPVKANDEIGRLATTFNAMLDRLEDAFATQRAFLDDASHELRTPITIIRGHLELMGDDPADRVETTALVMDELDRMTCMVDELLLLAKAQRPDFVHPEPIDVPAFTRELLAKARALGPRSWELDGVGRGTIVGDRQRLTQAVMNLARNAAQHTDDQASIGLGSSVAGGWVRLWVRDAGPGVRVADQERIFGRFARADSGGRRSEGSGLGLAIACAVVEAHHGRIDLDSEPGQGATFTVVLPAERLE